MTVDQELPEVPVPPTPRAAAPGRPARRRGGGWPLARAGGPVADPRGGDTGDHCVPPKVGGAAATALPDLCQVDGSA